MTAATVPIIPPSVLELLPADVAGVVRQHELEVLAALTVVLLTLLLLIIRRGGSGGSGGGKGTSVLLVGPAGGGKTTLFYQIKDGSTHLGTVASMVENEGTWTVLSKGRPAGTARVVDVPGHPSLRHRLEQHLRDAAAVVFVMDSVDISPSKVEAAEELFEVLTHPHVARARVPVLLACNKMDLETQAHSVDFIRRTLEKQLDAMRKTRVSMSPDVAGKVAALGKGDKPVSLAPGGVRSPVTLVGISAEKGDVEEVHAFLAKVL